MLDVDLLLGAPFARDEAVSIADDLGITYRTLQNWLNRTYAAKPDDVLPKLLVLLQQREKQIDDLVDDINGGINS